MTPFSAPGRWFRGNTHSHSTVSDGRVTVAERFAGYRESILAALRAGHFYSTQGPEILDLRLEEEEVAPPDGRRQRIP